MSEQHIDMLKVRARLEGSRGKDYWRSLEALAETPEFQAFLHREFPENASEWLDPVGRRGFLKLMGASLALAGVTACTKQPPEAIVPYVRQPEEIVPGKPLFFATSMPLGGTAKGLLVESHEGRPTKIEGNPDHPGSLGATDVFAQASVLTLYDPDRSQTITNVGDIKSWSDVVLAIRQVMAAQGPKRGAGLRLLTETVGSRALHGQIQQLLAYFPSAKWCQWDPAGPHNRRAGARLAFGDDVDPQYRIDQADVIVSLDSDVLNAGPDCLRHARAFASRRRLDGDKAAMSRLYAIESSPTNTGTKADHRLGIKAAEIAPFARALAAAIGVSEASGTAPAGAAAWIAPLAKDLQAHRGRSLIVAGDAQPPVVHALAHAMNEALGNVGTTVVYTQAAEAAPTDQLASLRELVGEMNAGQVDFLLVIGANPVYTAPVDLAFARAMSHVPLRMHMGLYHDETAADCHWHIPETHYLESWSDARAADGTASIIQPLIAPLYNGRSPHELLAAFTTRSDRTPYDIVREYWMANLPAGRAPTGTTAAVPAQASGGGNAAATRPASSGTPAGGAAQERALEPGVIAVPVPPAPAPTAAFEQQWRRWLHDGVIPDTAFAAKTVTVRATVAAAATPGAVPSGIELNFRPDPALYDGRFANNAWLQELPRPLTKLTWDNALLMGVSTAEKLRVVSGDVVELRFHGRTLVVPVFLNPGHPADVVTVTLGAGRTRAGKVGDGVGFNAYALRTSDEPWFGVAEIVKTGGREDLANTQDHWSLEGRNIVRTGTLQQFSDDPKFAQKMEHTPLKALSLYPEYTYDSYAWGMAIDQNVCTGCSACVVACVSENNIAVVGKEQVARGREMHWLRIDRYYSGDVENPDTYHQPMLCQQCENAPCELVCPVAATVHSSEGLNDMVYNRCVGTRYCSNNCPYKVRRFNFLLYSDFNTPALKPLRNPDVTVRSRGVMEKCTYCVQRISYARIEAKKEDRRVRDGEVRTACQAACPTDAIVFGDINDPESRVAQLKRSGRNYAVMAELNTRPRTTYLAIVRNPNPELEPVVTGRAGSTEGER